ncbi:peptidylprolyl isomerase [Polynucleobacter sp. AP-Sanab-80-C2]|jgi:peptidyl-prolyl cis-trans isomerase C|uniref:peptidylprolyl isomerase n=1 Tax=Polynucleobacter sp. AP-Sanab-80-C2 TaxID=3108274 RepID=UPI002B23983A|nr:peptidylprolyl isomerase [Polynucleobacter sp. AP-Sanab-80-C2]MEA9598465.1 peptidylprolyl isomerase [Polynucleobacter sp. AP-Sanab-80-C2]
MKPFMSPLKPRSVHLICAGLLSFALCSAAYAQQSGLPINAAASVNGAIITNDMVEQGIKVAISQGQKDSPELRKMVIEKFIEVLLLSQQAEKDGLANSEKANAQLTMIRQNYLADLELSTFMAQNPISDAEIQAEYNKQVASLGPQGMIMEYKISDIALATEADAQAALNRIKKGEAFDKVAKSVSLAPNKAQGGAAGWVQPGQVPPQISAVLVNLGKGQTSAPIQLQQGWYLVKLEDKKSSKPPTFEQAKPAIRAGLAQRKQFEFVSGIAKNSKIVVQ